MTQVSHHLSEELLIAYTAGTLPGPLALVVASHISMCTVCRAALSAHEAAAGLMLEDIKPVAPRDDLKARILAQLDAPARPEPVIGANGIYPAPLAEVLGSDGPKWRTLGFGSRQQILSEKHGASVRLLYIPAGMPVPDHSHEGLELTLVLQGAFRDATGRYGVGDLEIADDDLEHQPIAEPGEDCICLAATESALKFRSFLPRLFQPLLRI